MMIQGRKGDSGGQEAENTLQSNSLYKVIDLICEGEVESIDSIIFDDVDYINDEGEENFGGVTLTKKLGLPDQEHVSGFPAASTFVSIPGDGEITYSGGGITKEIGLTNTEIDAINLIVAVSSLNKSDDSGNIDPTTVSMKVSVGPSGGTLTELSEKIIFNGKTMSTFQKMYTIRNLKEIYGDAPWEIKVEREQPDRDSTENIRDRTFWQGYSEIIDEKLTYPNCAYVAFEVNAKNFGDKVPTRSFRGKWKKIRVPSNYDPLTRVYFPEVWDGEFKALEYWTDNPAWILYDLLTDDRYGVGIDDALVDKYGLYTIGKYCDIMVPDGKGDFEPRYTFNGPISNASSIYELINKVASNFNAMPYWSGDQVQFIQDVKVEKPYSMLVTLANIIGEFNYSGTSLTSRTTVVNVTWNNPDNHYENDIETVEDIYGIDRYGYNTKDVVAYGCTSQGQAHRYGKWLLYSEVYLTSMITYTAGMDHIDVMPGDVIEVNDSHKSGAQFGGRLKSVSGTSIVLDREVEFIQGNSYSLTCVLPDRSIEDRVINLSYGKYSELIIDAPFTIDPIVNSMWVISGDDVATELYKVIGVSDVSDGKFAVSALLYDENKFRYIDDLPLLIKPPVTRIPTGAITPPTDLQADQVRGIADTGVLEVGLFLSWTQSIDPRVFYYEVEIKKVEAIEIDGDNYPTGEFYLVGETSGNSLKQTGLSNGSYIFRVRAVAPTGKSMYVELTAPNVSGVSGPPPNPGELRATASTDGVTLSWDPIDDPMVGGYEIRVGDDSYSTWDESIVITKNFKGTFLVVPMINTGIHHFLIKTVSILGVYSNIASGVSITVTQPEDLSSFSVIKQDDSLAFSWSAVPGIGIEYEIRAGSSWGTSEHVLRSSGTSATKLFPGDGRTIFWIKAFSALGLESSLPRFWNQSITLVQNRNIIVESDQRELEWPGNKQNMVVNSSGELDPGYANGNFWGAYSFPIDLEFNTEARSWLDVRILSKTENSTTWEQADFTWRSDSADAAWIVEGHLEEVIMKKSIYIGNAGLQTEALLAPMTEDVEAFLGSGSLTSSALSTHDFKQVRLGTGVYFAPGTSGERLEYQLEYNLESFYMKYKLKLENNVAAITTTDADIYLSTVDLFDDGGTDMSANRHGSISIYKEATTGRMRFKFLNAVTGDETILPLDPYYESMENCHYFSIGVSRTVIEVEGEAEVKISVFLHCNEVKKTIEILSMDISLPTKTILIDQVDAGFTLSDLSVKEGQLSRDEMIKYLQDLSPIGYDEATELLVGDYDFENAIIDVETYAPSTSDPMALWKCKMFTDVIDVSENGSREIEADWTRINVKKRFNEIVSVIGQQKTGNVPVLFKVQNIDDLGFECRLERVDNEEPIGGEMEWVARGY